MIGLLKDPSVYGNTRNYERARICVGAGDARTRWERERMAPQAARQGTGQWLLMLDLMEPWSLLGLA